MERGMIEQETYERSNGDTSSNGGNRASADVARDAAASSERAEDEGDGVESLEWTLEFPFITSSPRLKDAT